MIQISRKEQQVLRKLKAVMAAEKAEEISQEMLDELLDQDAVTNLVNKGVIDVNPDTVSPDGTMLDVTYHLTKEQLQVKDDDPEVEQAWEDFRAVQGQGYMSKDYVRNKPAEEATKRLEKVLFDKGKLTHLADKDHGHIWVTEDRVQYWKNRGWKEASQTAVPVNLD